MIILPYLYAGLAVFLMNVVPAFMPATWTVLAFAAVNFGLSPFVLAPVGAVAATAGRYGLARLSRKFIRNRFLSERTIRNIDDIKTHLEKHKELTFGIFLSYAFSPLPSNQLFIAYGLTNMDLKRVTVPFFIGRLVSYFILASAVVVATKRLIPEIEGFWFSIYFVASQIITLLIVYLFTKINWHALLNEKKIRFIK